MITKTLSIILKIAVISVPVFTYSLELNGWNHPFLFFDPQETKGMLSDPAGAAQDSARRLQLTYLGFLPGGKSLIQSEALFPVGKWANAGFLFSGNLNENKGEFSFVQGEFDGQASLRRGILGLAFASRFQSYGSAGILPVMALWDQNGNVRTAWGGVAGIRIHPGESVTTGFSAGKFFQNPLGEIPVWAQGFLVWRFYSGRWVISHAYRIQKNEDGQYQCIGKIWLLKNAALRMGWDPIGLNGGLRLRIFFGTKEGFLEHYMGRGLYHHLHFLLRF